MPYKSLKDWISFFQQMVIFRKAQIISLHFVEKDPHCVCGHECHNFKECYVFFFNWTKKQMVRGLWRKYGKQVKSIFLVSKYKKSK